MGGDQETQLSTYHGEKCSHTNKYIDTKPTIFRYITLFSSHKSPRTQNSNTDSYTRLTLTNQLPNSNKYLISAVWSFGEQTRTHSPSQEPHISSNRNNDDEDDEILAASLSLPMSFRGTAQEDATEWMIGVQRWLNHEATSAIPVLLRENAIWYTGLDDDVKGDLKSFWEAFLKRYKMTEMNEWQRCSPSSRHG